MNIQKLFVFHALSFKHVLNTLYIFRKDTIPQNSQKVYINKYTLKLMVTIKNKDLSIRPFTHENAKKSTINSKTKIEKVHARRVLNTRNT